MSQVLDRGAQAVARGAARCASQVLGRVTQALARGAATQSQQEKINRQMHSGTELILRAFYVQ